jgi:hypothetical protein
MGGKTKTQKQTQESSPWKPQEKPLKFGFSEAERLYKTGGPKFFGGNTVAGFAPQQEDAFQRGTQRATLGNQTMRMAEGFNQDVLSGKYSGDPYEGQVFQNMQQRIMPVVNSQFMTSGRYGSGLQTDTATRALTESFAPYASNMYQQGIDRMGQAASMAPTFADNDYTDLAALMGIGSQIQGQNQAEIDADRERFEYEQNLPFNNLGMLMNNIGGNYGGTVVSKSKVPQPGLLSQVAGGALGIAGGLGGLGWRPFG